MIKFDRTQRSVVAICTPCGTRRLFNDQTEADKWALSHVYVAHPEPSSAHMQAITAGRVRAHRRDDTP